MSIPQDLLCKTDGKCYANFKRDGKMDKPANYLILDTDYENYTIVYTCLDLPGGIAHFDTLWYLLREPTLIEGMFETQIAPIIKAAIPKYNYDRWGTWPTQGHDVCTYD